MYSTLLIAAFALGAPCLKDPPKKTPSVVGVWVAESYTYAGKPRAVGPRPIRYEFTAEGKWHTYRGERRATTDRIYFINLKTDPPSIDLNYDPAEQDPPMGRGIFKVEGDTMTLCFIRNKSARPTSFESTTDPPAMLYVFKRVKD
jgi:uncharacterized protein (TIGR03067 family)